MKLEGRVRPKMHPFTQATWDDGVISSENFAMISRLPPSSIHHLEVLRSSKSREQYQNVLKMTLVREDLIP